VRLPKLRDMFASRACRSAVMIGTALERHKMKTIVEHLSDLDQVMIIYIYVCIICVYTYTHP